MRFDTHLPTTLGLDAVPSYVKLRTCLSHFGPQETGPVTEFQNSLK